MKRIAIIVCIGMIVGTLWGHTEQGQTPHSSQDHVNHDGIGVDAPVNDILMFAMLLVIEADPTYDNCVIEFKDWLCRPTYLTPSAAVDLFANHLTLEQTGCYKVCASGWTPHYEVSQSGPCMESGTRWINADPQMENGGPKVVCLDKAYTLCDVWFPRFSGHFFAPCELFVWECKPGCQE